MIIFYERKFIKDLEKLNPEISKKLQIIILKIKWYENFSEIKNLKKITWFKNYYRLRIWEYRLWIKFENWNCIFQRLKHRKDIYKIFP